MLSAPLVMPDTGYIRSEETRIMVIDIAAAHIADTNVDHQNARNHRLRAFFLHLRRKTLFIGVKHRFIEYFPLFDLNGLLHKKKRGTFKLSQSYTSYTASYEYSVY